MFKKAILSAIILQMPKSSSVYVLLMLSSCNFKQCTLGPSAFHYHSSRLNVAFDPKEDINKLNCTNTQCDTTV